MTAIMMDTPVVKKSIWKGVAYGLLFDLVVFGLIYGLWKVFN